MSLVQDRQSPSRIPSSRGHLKPKGILKHTHSPTTLHSLQWDEANLALTEIDKDSLMKILEPKTPFVRYNPLTDEIEIEGGSCRLGKDDDDIPRLELDLALAHAPSPCDEELPSISASSAILLPTTGTVTSGPSSRRTSISSVSVASSCKPASISGKQGSGASSRRTSFNLPNAEQKKITTCTSDDLGASFGGEKKGLDPEGAARHAEFVRARGRHYSNEAEAMKRAVHVQLLDEEEEEEARRICDDDDNMLESVKGVPEHGDQPKINGLTVHDA